MWQYKMDNPEALAAQCTKDEDKQSNNTTYYVLDVTIFKQTNKQTNTNNLNKT